MVLVSGLSTIYSQPSTGAQAPAYDGNGNILAYLDCATGTPTQRMEYDAFGVEMSLDSVLTQPSTSNSQLPFRFSTKNTDSETALSYYGYRYYSAELGRWTNRDPIEEHGGVNLYGMVGNRPNMLTDLLGKNPAAVAGGYACGCALSDFLFSIGVIAIIAEACKPDEPIKCRVVSERAGGAGCDCWVYCSNGWSGYVPCECGKNHGGMLDGGIGGSGDKPDLPPDI